MIETRLEMKPSLKLGKVDAVLLAQGGDAALDLDARLFEIEIEYV